MEITTAMLLTWLRRTAAIIREQRDVLTNLDTPIGDADHGANLDRGFRAVVATLPALEGRDAGTLLRSAGMRLIATVGGASGPLYGTAFRRAGAMVDGQYTLTARELLALLRAFTDGVRITGKAERGQKTMLDALLPAVETLEVQLNAGAPLAAAMHCAASAADAGAQATIPLMARRGRAALLGERTIGHQDPGATSSALLVRALAVTLTEGS